MKKNKYTMIMNVLLSVILFLCMSPITTIQAEDNDERQIVKVGYYQVDGYYEKSDDGSLSGYGYELLQNIAGYAGFDYEYVGYDKSLNEIIQMLESGEIDMLTAVQYSEERDEIFDYSDSPVGYNETLLLTTDQNTKLISEDYSTYENMRVGMVTGRPFNEKMFKLAEEHNFSFEPVYYDTQEEIDEALKTGEEIDAALCSSMSFLDKDNILERLSRSPYYIVVKQGNTKLLNQINEAIDQMNVNNPSWMSDIYQKYYSASYSELYLSTQQKSYLEKLKSDNQTIPVLINPDLKPYSYYEDGNPKGILVEYFNEVAKLYDLDVEYIKFDTAEEYLQAIKDYDHALVLAPYFQRYESEMDGYCLTQSFLDATCCVLTRTNFTDYNSLENNKVAVVKGMTTIVQELKQDYSQVELVYYETSDECVEAVKKQEVDATVLYNYTAYWYLNNNWDNEIQMFEMPKSSIGFSIAVSKDFDPKMYELMDYAISATSGNLIQSIVFSNIIVTNKANISLWTIVERNPIVVNIIVIIVAVIALIIILSITKKYTSAEKEKRKEAEYRAKHDALTGAWNRLELESMIKNPDKISKKVAVLMGDIDHFKEINDTYGHDTGDWVLQKLVNEFQSYFRGNDKIIRMGGDEFLIILQNFDYKSWSVISDKMSEIHEALNKDFKEEMKVSLSVGISFSEDGINDELLKAVDVALYHVKKMGRAGCAIANEKKEIINYWKVNI